MKESGLEEIHGEELVNKFFGLLKNVQKRLNLDNYDLFQCFDLQRDGFITIKELQKILEEMNFVLNEPQYDEFIKVLDKNDDNKINFYEFNNYLNRATPMENSNVHTSEVGGRSAYHPK